MCTRCRGQANCPGRGAGSVCKVQGGAPPHACLQGVLLCAGGWTNRCMQCRRGFNAYGAVEAEAVEGSKGQPGACSAGVCLNAFAFQLSLVEAMLKDQENDECEVADCLCCILQPRCHEVQGVLGIPTTEQKPIRSQRVAGGRGVLIQAQVRADSQLHGCNEVRCRHVTGKSCCITANAHTFHQTHSCFDCVGSMV
jgi:hypothetical protein